jgi:hypothetical protein
MKYGIIYWGNSSDSKTAFTLQKKIVRIMMGVKSRNLYRLEILTHPCEYMFSLITFITNNEEHFQTNSDVHSVNTRQKHHLHEPTVTSHAFKKGCGMSNSVVWRDNHVKLQQMFIAVRSNTADEQGSRVCLMNTGKNSLPRGLA